jgi:tetratricopeptide (TPR) repeat protein
MIYFLYKNKKGLVISEFDNDFKELINDAHNNVNTKNYKKAILCYKQALQFSNKNSQILFNIAVNYIYQEEYNNSIEYLIQAIKINPKYIRAYINLGIAYKRLKQYNKAIQCFKKSLELKKDDPDIYYNLANVYSCLEEYSLAIKYFNIVFTLDKNYYKAYHGLGLVYNNLLQYKKAMALFEHTLKINNNYADAIFAKALIQLREKDYINGWINYESRFEANNPLKKLTYNIPFYDGEDLTNKAILIQEEQGFGDNIQFIRYIKKLQEKNPKKIYLALRYELSKLFKLIDNIIIVNDDDTVYDIDYIVSLLSLPKIFKTTFDTIPNAMPYLPMPTIDTLEQNIIQQTPKLKVGFAYSGNKDHSNDKYRSIPLEIFKELFAINTIEFYNLQVSQDSNDNLNELIKEYDNIYDCTIQIQDFYDSALIINKLDVIISIDSALAHFCGAYNKKTFLLLPTNAEWRWFNTISYSPWYPSLKLFRQKELGLWIEVISKVKEELELLVINKF